MRTIRVPTAQDQRRRTIPSTWDRLTEIIADGESKTRHAFHARWTSIGRLESAGPVLCAAVGGVECGGVHAVVEEKEGLQVCGAGFGRECGFVFGFSCVAFAEPFDASEIVDVGLGFCGRVAGNGFVVLRDGDFSCVDIDVVGAEAGEWNGGVGRSFYVEQGGNPWEMLGKAFSIG